MRLYDFGEQYYEIDFDGKGDSFYEAMKILNDNSYRQDFRNLLPWSLDTVSVDGSTCSVSLSFTWGDTLGNNCSISYLDGNTVSVRHGETDRVKIYHPTDHSTLNSLAEYLQLYGDIIYQQ